jgi:hypothetical protein
VNSLERVQKMVHDMIVMRNADVDPTTVEYALGVSDDTITLFYHDDATHSFIQAGEYVIQLKLPFRAGMRYSYEPQSATFTTDSNGEKSEGNAAES